MKDNLFIKIILILLLVIVSRCISSESDINLGDGYHLFGSGLNAAISREDSSNKGVYDDIIIGRIVSLMRDNKYIVVYREVDEKSKVYFQGHNLWTEMNNTPINQFWIIDKNNGTVYGPMDFIEYINVKKEKGIKVKLEL